GPGGGEEAETEAEAETALSPFTAGLDPAVSPSLTTALCPTPSTSGADTTFSSIPGRSGNTGGGGDDDDDAEASAGGPSSTSTGRRGFSGDLRGGNFPF